MADLFPVLSRAVSQLRPNTAQAREALYNNARDMLDAQIEKAGAALSLSDAVRQRAALEVAIQRIEASFSRDAGIDDVAPSAPDIPERPHRLLDRRRPLIYVMAAGAAVVAAIIGAVGYHLLSMRSGRQTARNELSATYIFLQQPVFYRSEQPVGTVLIDKQQYFLYLVRSPTMAWRYGVAIGAGCADIAGLYKITKKETWPGVQTATNDVHVVDAALAQSPSGPEFGARAVYFGSDYRIHGTNQPSSVGHGAAEGCVRLTNDSVIGLFDRVALDQRIIVIE